MLVIWKTECTVLIYFAESYAAIYERHERITNKTVFDSCKFRDWDHGVLAWTVYAYAIIAVGKAVERTATRRMKTKLPVATKRKPVTKIPGQKRNNMPFTTVGQPAQDGDTSEFIIL